MSLSDSMFLFELVIEELKSYIDCNEFYIRSQFADVFSLNLKDPNELVPFFSKRTTKKKLRRKTTKVRNGKGIIQTRGDAKVETGQSVLFASNIDLLISNMRKYPLELSLWSKDDPDYKLGSTDIQWSLVYIDYIDRLFRKQEPQTAIVTGEYNVFDEFTSKRMATIKMKIKLSHLNDKITTKFKSLSEANQQTFMYTGFNSKPTKILSTIKDTPNNYAEETGVVKTTYGGSQRKLKTQKAQYKTRKSETNDVVEDAPNKEVIKTAKTEIMKLVDNVDDTCRHKSIVALVKSDTDIDKNKQVEMIKSKSCSSINRQQFNILNYIFGDNNGPYGNQVYCVGYFTVENDHGKDTGSSKSSIKDQSSEKSDKPIERYKVRLCDSECPSRKVTDGTCSQSVCSLDLPEDAAHLISVTKCKQVECNNKPHREVPSASDNRILLDLSNFKRQCYDVTEKVEQVVGSMKAKMKFEDDPCFCLCECKFGFTKKTTYCTICGGYEHVSEGLARTGGSEPFPCPIFHKLVDKNKLKTWSTSGSDSKRRPDESQKSLKGGSKSDKRSIGPDKSVESEKDSKKSKKTKKDDRFKFNYGYQGIPPQIGHSQCAFPCTGTLRAVPKSMGWLWTAENIPGMKFRPMWKPGAINKHVVRLLRMAKNPGEVMAKKRRKVAGKKKKPLKRPLLVVQKKDGEFTITMETMKTYAKPRAINQMPYEDKPVVTYTIGRTDEENRERQKRKERELRRLERAQRQFIQSAFQDVCREICLKTYQQALGILPDAENPDCPCYPAHPDADRGNMDVSCSCSEEKSSIGSDTESDEWVVEFTPPNALFDPTFKGKKVQKIENDSQYTYLDYKVKLMDRYGNPVPRFFKGPDGKQQCSDLGGFWSPGHQWLEINVDGYVASDGRWAPNSFIGPNGEQIDSDTGTFQSANGKWLMVGIDGYVDCHGKWKFYPKPRSPQKKSPAISGKRGAGDKKDDKPVNKQSEATWSCFGDITPRQLSKMGIVGHGQDKKLLLSTLKDLLAHGEDVKIPQPSTVPQLTPFKGKTGGRKRRLPSPNGYDSKTYFQERTKCRHPVPSDKGVVAVDEYGHKAYFRLKDYKNKRPKERLADLKGHGISLSSFHVPCLHSFINSEVMKQKQLERLIAISAKSKCVSTQVD